MEEPTPLRAMGTSANPFAPVQQPDSRARKAIQRFLAERAHYESAVATKLGLRPISFADSIDPIFLQSLLVIRVFGTGFIDFSDLTDDIIKAKLTDFLPEASLFRSTKLWQTFKRNVRLDFAEPDTRIFILMLQTSYVEHSKRRG